MGPLAERTLCFGPGISALTLGLGGLDRISVGHEPVPRAVKRRAWGRFYSSNPPISIELDDRRRIGAHGMLDFAEIRDVVHHIMFELSFSA